MYTLQTRVTHSVLRAMTTIALNTFVSYSCSPTLNTIRDGKRLANAILEKELWSCKNKTVLPLAVAGSEALSSPIRHALLKLFLR